jgi:hypothetical protein
VALLSISATLVVPRGAQADVPQPFRLPSLREIHYASGKTTHYGTVGPHRQPSVALIAIGGSMVANTAITLGDPFARRIERAPQSPGPSLPVAPSFTVPLVRYAF